MCSRNVYSLFYYVSSVYNCENLFKKTKLTKFSKYCIIINNITHWISIIEGGETNAY